jgi:opacity protein-like surface antigen
MSKRMLGAITVCLFLFTAPVYAESEDEVSEYARNGVYLMASAAYAVEKFESWDLKNSYGAGARLGYRLHPRLAAEVEYQWLGGFHCGGNLGCYTSGGPGATGVEAKQFIGQVATVNAKAFALTGRVQPYALVGIGGGTFEVKKKQRTLLPDGVSYIQRGFSSRGGGFVARYGGGVDLYGDEQWAIFAEAAYVVPWGDIQDLDYVSIEWGFLWRF